MLIRHWLDAWKKFPRCNKARCRTNSTWQSAEQLELRPLLSAVNLIPQTDSTNPLNGVDLGSNSTPTLGDLNGDGKLDLIAGDSTGVFHYYINTGTILAPAFTEQTGTDNPLNGVDIGDFSAPALGDLNGDGLLDLIVGDNTGLYRYYKNTGTLFAPAFTEQTGNANPMKNFDAGDLSAPVLADLDGNRDLDILAGNAIGAFRYYENNSITLPSFLERGGDLNPMYQVDLGNNSAPALGDLNGDGKLDLIAGDSTGSFRCYLNTGSIIDPMFIEQSGADNPLNGVDVGDFSAPAFGDLNGDGKPDLIVGDGSGAFHYYVNSPDTVKFVAQRDIGNPLNGLDLGSNSTPTFGDLDGDGDLDSIAGDANGLFHYFRNDGTSLSAAFTERTGTANPLNGLDVGSNSSPTLGDLNGDGKLDLIVGDSNGVSRYYINTGTPLVPAFTEQTGTANPLNGVDAGSSSTPTLGDLDHDGDLDLIAGDSTGILHYYINTGTPLAPAFTEQTGTDNPLNGFKVESYSTPVFGDLDGDGDLDLIVGDGRGYFHDLENNGTSLVPLFVEQLGRDNPLSGNNVPNRSAPALGDLDGDGDLDLVAGDEQGQFNYWLHTTDTFGFILRTGPLANPFDDVDVGDNSTPTFGDLNNDGKLDLISGDSAGLFHYYINTGTYLAPAFSEQTAAANPLNGIDVGDFSTPALGDLNGDGKLDLIVGNGSGLFRYFINTGTLSVPAFTEQTGAANPLDGVDVGDFSTPTLADVNGDGMLDLVTGCEVGTISYYKNTGTTAAPLFTKQNGASNPLVNGSSVHYSVPTLGDLDGDGDLDFIVGNDTGGYKLFLNTGTSTVPVYLEQTAINSPLRTVTVGISSTPTLQDLDADGKQDLIAGDVNGIFHYYRNVGTALYPVFQEQTGVDANPLNTIDVGFYSKPTAADLNGDGNPDLLAGDQAGFIHIYLNTGTAYSPTFVEQTGPINYLRGVDLGSYSAPSIGDLDGGGDFEFLAGDAAGRFHYFRNSGTPTYPVLSEQTGAFNTLDVGFNSTPALGDLNGDGKLDFIAGESTGALHYFINTGTLLVPDFTEQTGAANPLNGADVGDKSTPALLDLDGDGDLDLVVGNQAGLFRYYKNVGTALTPLFTEQIGAANPLNGIDVGNDAAPSPVDLDGDGDLDLIVGNNNGKISYFMNDHAPTDVSISGNSVPENNPVGTSIGILGTVDPNLQDTFSYALVSGPGGTDNDSFRIVGNQLKTKATFDFETKNSYSILVRTTDPAGAYFDKVITIRVTDLNEAPVLNPAGIPALKSIPRDIPSANNPGTLVSQLIANMSPQGGITDPDAAAKQGIAIVQADQASGTWQFATTGNNWLDFGTPSSGSALLLASDAATRVRFIPNAGFQGTATFTFRAWDQSDGSANGSTTPITIQGGASPFSSATDSAVIVVNAATSIGIARDGGFYLDLNNNGAWNGAAVDAYFKFGNSTDTPLAGDWNGDGQTDVGSFRNGTFFLDLNGNRQWDSATDTFFTFGNPTDIPITGDWNGDGKTDIGTFRNGTFFLDANGSRKWESASDVAFNFGNPTDIPVTGDWNADGKTDVGTFRNGTFFLDANGSRKWESASDVSFAFGIANDIPITGDWNGDGKTDVGTFRSGTFYLDQNGNRKWDGASDKVYKFGIASDKPIAGNWTAASAPASLVITNNSPTTSTEPASQPAPQSSPASLKTHLLHKLKRALHKGKNA